MPSTFDQITLTTKQAMQALEVNILCDQPTVVWGSYGIGKSDMYRQVADLMGQYYASTGEIDSPSEYGFLDIRASMMSEVDAHGLPVMVTDENGRQTVKWIPWSKLPTSGYGIILLDEVNRASVPVMNALLQFVLDRRMGDYTLPAGWRIMAACNRESDGGGVQRMTAALASRFGHINVETSLDDWSRWAVQHDIHPMVLGYVRFASINGKSALLDPEPTERASANPRAWASVSKQLHTLDAAGRKLDYETQQALVCGLVGAAHGIAFMGFRAMFASMPNVDGILLDPTHADIPTETSVLYCVTATLASRATQTNFENVVTYLRRLDEEYMVMGVRDATRRNPALKGHTAFTRWFIDSQELFA